MGDRCTVRTIYIVFNFGDDNTKIPKKYSQIGDEQVPVVANERDL